MMSTWETSCMLKSPKCNHCLHHLDLNQLLISWYTLWLWPSEGFSMALTVQSLFLKSNNYWFHTLCWKGYTYSSYIDLKSWKAVYVFSLQSALLKVYQKYLILLIKPFLHNNTTIMVFLIVWVAVKLPWVLNPFPLQQE